MSENTIFQISQMISNNVHLTRTQKESLSEIEFSISKINSLLEKEKIRKNLVKNELKLNTNSNINDLKEYLNSIENNIVKLDFFLELLENKKRVVTFDTKSYFKSLSDVNIHQSISLQ